MRSLSLPIALSLVLFAAPGGAQNRSSSPAAPGRQSPGRQAVVETTAGTFVMDLLPDIAPEHVAHFTKLVQDGAYTGTTFHRMVKYGIVFGGDPLSKDPAKRDLYGTGGLGALEDGPTSEKQTRGAVSTVLVPGKPNSGGAQFFIAVVDQPGLDGKYTVFARVAEGMRVVEKISETPVDEKGKAIDRVEIKSITLRDRPPVPFSTETATDLTNFVGVLETSAGPITIEFFPGKAPEHVRNFLRLASVGVYDGMAFHRIARGFVIQTGYLPTRREKLADEQKQYVHTLQPEFNDTKHVKGIVSMAHGDDPASADTSFFICTADAAVLDGKYTAFGRVVDGLAAVDAIEATPTTGETPTTRIELLRVRIERRR